jgi:hypothetical protein
MADSTYFTTSFVSFPTPPSNSIARASLNACCDIFSIFTLASDLGPLAIVSIASLELSPIRIYHAQKLGKLLWGGGGFLIFSNFGGFS